MSEQLSEEEYIVREKQQHPDYCVFETHYKGTLHGIGEDVKALREKVFNGLSDLPEEIKWIRRLLIGVLVSALLAFAASTWTSVQQAARMEVLLQKTTSIGEAVE